jgi:GNAT superfamily N-acetyltransferase
MIRVCTDRDFDSILEIINDAAQAYRGIIPQDRWHEPYMARRELGREIGDGVVFYGYEEEGVLSGIMGIQDRCDVSLIRHAYVRTARRNCGIGTRLLDFLQSTTDKPLLVGTWAAASWAIAFYERKGYRILPPHEKDALLRKYWTIPERQVETSVVLAGPGWPRP